MSGSNTGNSGRTGPQRDDRTTARARRERVSALLGRSRLGTVALVAGGALLVRALRAETRPRRAIQAVAGLALLGLGLRQRLAPDTGSDAGRPGSNGEDGDDGPDSTGTGTDTTTRTAHAVEDTTNPRDVSQEPDVETETGLDEGSVQFTTDHEAGPRSESHREEAAEGEGDPRDSDETDAVEVDLSEPAMADEPNEATGPQPEQAEPASTEETEPEASPPEDASHVQADEPEMDGQDDGVADDVSGETGDDASGESATDGEDVSTEDRYEGEREGDATVDDSDESGADERADEDGS